MKKTFIDLILESNIGPTQKARLILIIRKRKPGAYIRVYKGNDSIELLSETLKKAGLFFVEVKPAIDVCAYSLAVGKNIEIANGLKDAHLKNDYAKKGRLSGYPESAVIAYTLGSGLRSWDYPDDMKNNPLAFRFSKVGPKAEIELVRSWVEEIRNVAPDLFQEMYGHMMEKA
jgi:hypothetical protein